MHRLFVRLMAVAAFVHLIGTAGKAQLVQVGPGYVKAPFVRVYSHPDGSSYVRAPFVKVFTPGHGIPINDLPEPEDFAEMDWRELRESIRRLAGILDAELDQFRTGDLWKVELKTAEIRALMHGDGPPTADQSAKLQEILHTHEATMDNPRVQVISKLNSFQALAAALREYLAPPAERLRRQLSAASHDLHLSLDRLRTGTGWQKYLALPEGIAQAQGNDARGGNPTASDVAELDDVLHRFDAVSQNDEYRAIARLPEFRLTHEHLAAYLEHVMNPSRRPQPSVEELPVPPPNKRSG